MGGQELPSENGSFPLKTGELEHYVVQVVLKVVFITMQKIAFDCHALMDIHLANNWLLIGTKLHYWQPLRKTAQLELVLLANFMANNTFFLSIQ